MKVLFFLRYSTEHASSRVRGLFIAKELRKKGLTCELTSADSKKSYMRYLAKSLGYEIIYFQKRYSKTDILLNKFARIIRKKTIFDIDDAPSLIIPDHETKKRAIQMMKKSSAVVVASHELEDFAHNFNHCVYCVPTSIDLNWYKPETKRLNQNFIKLGWIGHGINYKKDLLMLIKPIEKISKKYNIKVTIVGARGQKEIHESFGRMENVEVEIIDSIKWSDPRAVPSAICDFDVGLYPLLDNEYNRYKGGFKALEYMAMEIPVLASPIGENKFIIEHGQDGFLVKNEKDWERYLFYLAGNESVRRNMGKKGRSKVEANYSIQVSANKLIKIFESMANISECQDTLSLATF